MGNQRLVVGWRLRPPHRPGDPGFSSLGCSQGSGEVGEHALQPDCVPIETVMIVLTQPSTRFSDDP